MIKPLQVLPEALVFDTHDNTRGNVLAAARTYLQERGIDHWTIDEALADQPGLVVIAWWAGAGIGFCGKDHPAGKPVTVVNLPAGFLA